MKKILIISDSIKRKTGYACVARNLFKNLIPTGKYKFAQLGLADIPGPVIFPEIDYYSQVKDHTKCCKKGNVIEFKPANEVKVQFLNLNPKSFLGANQTPCVKGRNQQADNYAFDSVFFVIQHFKPDIVISINDIWGLYNILHLRNRKAFKFLPYLAIDSDCLFPGLQPPQHRPGLPAIDSIGTIKSADKCIVFTDWAQEVINKTAKIVTRGSTIQNLITIPHGVDTSIWKPLGEKKEELKRELFNLTGNEFLIGSVARSQPRKRLDAIFQTMRIFIDKYEKNRKIMCYFHCALEDRLGWDLFWLANWYGVTDRCIFDKNLKPGMGPTDEQLNRIVNSFDAKILLCNSEGFCLPALECAAAGIPVVITNYSAHADWGKDTLIFVKVSEYEHEPRTGFIKAVPSVKDAAKQLKLLYQSKNLVKHYHEAGIKLGKKLDWKNICKEWEKLLDSTDISDLDPNRYDDPKLLPPELKGDPRLNLKHFPKEDVNLNNFPNNINDLRE